MTEGYLRKARSVQFAQEAKNKELKNMASKETAPVEEAYVPPTTQVAMKDASGVYAPIVGRITVGDLRAITHGQDKNTTVTFTVDMENPTSMGKDEKTGKFTVPQFGISNISYS